MSALKAVVIGSSGHYEYIFESIKKNFKIVAVSTGSPKEQTNNYNDRFKDSFIGYKVYDNPIKMLDEERPDIAIINTIFNLNGYYLGECIKRKIHTFCEKPIVDNIEKLNLIEKLYYENSMNNSLILMSMFGISYEKHFVTAEKLLEEGTIGELRLIETQKSYKLGNREWFYHTKETYPGTIPWVSIHGIEWMYGVCDAKFDCVFSKQSSLFNKDYGDMETTCTSTFFNNEKQIIGIATSDYFRPQSSNTHDDDRMRCVGTKGILEVTNRNVYLNEELAQDLLPKRYIFDEFLGAIEGLKNKRTFAEYTFDVTKAALIARDSAYKKVELNI